jgi:uncharacterized protein GlcG (DUF336 family)
MAELALDTAHSIINGALAYAREKGLNKLTVAVLDERGALKAFSAEDGTSLKRGDIAIGKAAACIALGIGGRGIDKLAKARPYFITAVGQTVGGSFIPVPGGVLIRSEDGRTLGAVGISGDNSENDEAAAVAGIRQAGLTADPGEG